ncbi:unnamed protein product, partial [marine sediment metagenome]
NTEAHMDRFTRAVKSMSVAFGESTEALSGGLYDILSASVAPEQALHVLSVAVKAARAGMTDTKVAADALTTVLNSYGMAASRAAEVSDLLFTIVKRGKTTFAQLAPQIGKVASIAAVANVSLEELGAMIALLTRVGLSTDRAMTAIRATITSFLKPTEEAAEYAKRLGFVMSSATLKAEGLRGVFERISHLPPDAIAKLFPNVRALAGIIPALSHIRELSADIQGMVKSAGSTEVAYKKMTNTLAFQFDKVKQSVKILAVEIGEALLGTIKELVASVS